MDNCQDRPTFFPEAVWKALMNLPALRYMKAPVNTEAELYEKYPVGNEKGTFAFVHNDNTFYTYHPRGWNHGKWKPIAGGLESFFDIDAEFLKEGDILVYDSSKEKFVVKSGNIWNKLIDKASSAIQVNRFLNEVEVIPTIESDAGVYFVHKNVEVSNKTIEFRALYIVLNTLVAKKVVKIWNSYDYFTATELQDKLDKKANQTQVDDIAASVDVLSVTKAEKSVVDALLSGIIKQPAVDTYNTGSNSLASVYGLTAANNGSNGKAKQNGWDVLIRKDETKGGISNRYNWNGSIWVDMETGNYSEDLATKKELSELGEYVIDESEYMRIYTDSEGRFLWGIKNDGSIEWSKGIPMPIQIELNKVISQIIDMNADLDFKVDKERGYSLIADAVSEYFNNVNDTDFLEIKTDSEGRILQGITRDGKPYYPKNAMYDIVDSDEYVELVLDRNDKIVHCVKPDNDSDIVTVSEVLDENVIGQIYRGGYIEIQPDSYNAGSIPATDSTTDAWGFPYSLNEQEQLRLRNLMLSGDGYGVMYIRLPLGYAYRGYRNIDPTTSLAKNIGERYEGQNKALKQMCENIAKIGGGIAPEYWCHAPYWLTSGAYAGKGKNEISAGVNAENGTTQKTPLRTIKNTFPTQYNSRINEYTDAILDDLEYLHQNVAPVRMFGLQNEPELGGTEYGSVEWDAQTYNDVLEVLIPKIDNSEILSVYDGKPNKVLIHVASTYAKHFNGIPSVFIANHANKIWGYSHHYFLYNPDSNQYIEPDYINDIKGNRKNVFNNEFEYFVPSYEVSVMHQRCANNIQHIINELVHGEAEVIQPIIHICKQLGQNSATSNTVGYSMFECNLQEGYGYPINSTENAYRLNYGEFKINNQNYNSWKMFADNLPIGAVRIGNKPTTKRNGFSWCAYMAKGKRVIFVSNNSGSAFKFKLRLNARSSFAMKRYDLFNCGADMGTIVTSRINVEIPLYSGVCFVEQ